MSAGTLGILGGGQLAWMLAAAAERLSVAVRCCDLRADVPAATCRGFQQVDTWRAAVDLLAAGTDAITWEREDLPAADLRAAPSLHPHAGVVDALQDRVDQKTTFDRHAIPTAPWCPADGPADAERVIAEIGLPVMVKARRGGFDGRGQAMARDRGDLDAALTRFAGTGAMVERLVPFDDEFAVLATRGAGGIVHYPVVWTHQEDGQLSWARAPHPRAAQLAAWARPVIERLLVGIDHRGTLAMECFRCGDEAVVNEVAPRVHNSGHWSIEGCAASQFDNHVRAVMGLELAPPAPHGHCLLLNAIGDMPADPALPGVHVHAYGKAARPGRKVGHLTLHAADPEALERCWDRLPASLRRRWRLGADAARAG